MILMLAQDFLQAHHIRRRLAQGLAQVVQHESPIEAGESLVGIDGQYRQAPVGFVGRDGHGLSGGNGSTTLRKFRA
ncbi:hypothetical protein D3C81_2167210 [compost metagenome]